MIQWLPDHPRYEAAEAFIDAPDASFPRIHFFLTERVPIGGSKPQHHYFNDFSLIQEIGASELQVEQTPIELQRHEDENGTIFELALDTGDGPVRWRFAVQPEPAATSSGRLIDNARAAHGLAHGFLVFYLEASTPARSGTQLHIGSLRDPLLEASNAADDERATTPHAFYSRGAHNGYFPALDLQVIPDDAAVSPRKPARTRALGLVTEIHFYSDRTEYRSRTTIDAASPER